MPGSIVSVPVKRGQAVSRGETLVVMESMKMETTLVAPRDGVVAHVSATEGAQVSGGATLVALEEDAAS